MNLRSVVFASLSLLAAATAVPTSSYAQSGHDHRAGPILELPDPNLRTRRLQLRSPFGTTTLGGYGEVHYNWAKKGAADPNASIDLHRMVLFVGHDFNDRISMQLELEVEHAIAGNGQPGEVSVEQMFIDWDLLERGLTLRTGVVLAPMGIVNEIHEPPTFHGVERPMVEKVIIPSTWREAGIGFIGNPIDQLRYRVYVVGGLDASGFSVKSGIRGGRQKVGNANINGVAITGTVEWLPIAGFVVGASGYWGQSGKNMDAALFDDQGKALDLDVPTTGISAHAMYKGHGFEARGVFATFLIGDTAALRNAKDASGQDAGTDVASQTIGGYAEVAWNVFSVVESIDLELLPFFRFEKYNTAHSFDGRATTDADRAYNTTDIVMGLTMRPIPQVVFKADMILRSFGGGKGSDTLFDLGVGFNF